MELPPLTRRRERLHGAIHGLTGREYLHKEVRPASACAGQIGRKNLPRKNTYAGIQPNEGPDHITQRH